LESLPGKQYSIGLFLSSNQMATQFITPARSSLVVVNSAALNYGRCSFRPIAHSEFAE
jgi:hypothetical protein